MASEVEWWRAVNQQDRTWDLGPQALAALSGDKEREFLAMVHAGARHGFQFLFDAVRVSDLAEERAARGLLLDRLVSALNHPASLATFASLVGDPRVALVDGQATRYLPGHFLTAHDDGNAGKNRIAAWVLSLTPGWRTDWGGLLQFHDAGGDLAHALMPRFNAIHLFRVPQVHSVSLVAPFAAGPRLSVTGWLRWREG
ncbi:MAG TPA: 2OG-Fe(II) oxygenase family protein [Novosphingobium sp.]|nr:2OG-Fe(II) oxygenase family protein [Novosphingobium sp.]